MTSNATLTGDTRRAAAAGIPSPRREPFDMAAHRKAWGAEWGAAAKAASARLRKAHG